MAIYRLTQLTIHPVLHSVSVVRLSFALYREGYLPASSVAVICRGWVLHAAVLLRTVPALQQSAFKVRSNLAILGFPLPTVGQGCPIGADTAKGYRIELEFAGRKGGFPALVRQVLVPLAVLVFLLGKPRVPATELIVRHIAVDLPLVQVLHIGFIGEASVSGDDGALLVDV